MRVIVHPGTPFPRSLRESYHACLLHTRPYECESFEDSVSEFKDEVRGHTCPPDRVPQGPTHPPYSPLAPTGKMPFRQQYLEGKVHSDGARTIVGDAIPFCFRVARSIFAWKERRMIGGQTCHEHAFGCERMQATMYRIDEIVYSILKYHE